MQLYMAAQEFKLSHKWQAGCQGGRAKSGQTQNALSLLSSVRKGRPDIQSAASQRSRALSQDYGKHPLKGTCPNLNTLLDE